MVKSMRDHSMQSLHVVPKDEPIEVTKPVSVFPARLVVQWILGFVALLGLGSWLVWWEAAVQRTFVLEDIRGACQRVMPETVNRCVDTVIIQRGGARP